MQVCRCFLLHLSRDATAWIPPTTEFYYMLCYILERQERERRRRRHDESICQGMSRKTEHIIKMPGVTYMIYKDIHAMRKRHIEMP